MKSNIFVLSADSVTYERLFAPRFSGFWHLVF